MGTWGTGLYSGDFAMDLRTTVGAVLRLPFAVDRLVEILCDTEPAASRDRGNEEHTIFWLILADQFARRGIVSDRVRDRALEIIDGAEDLAALERLGMTPPDLRKRRKTLDEVRARVTAAPVDKPRVVLKKPQPLLMGVGDAIVYPTCAGRCVNPYFASRELDRHYTPDGPAPWRPDGWAAAVIVACGRAFDFLAWYQPLVVVDASSDKPTLASLSGDLLWRLELAGTCSASHFKKMELEAIGRLPVDRRKVDQAFPDYRPLERSAAVNDISISNRLHAIPAGRFRPLAMPGEPRKGRTPAMRGIDQILSA